MEDALYEITEMRQFALLSLDKAIPDRTTIINFRHLLEKQKLTLQVVQNRQSMAVGLWRDDSGNVGGCDDY